MEWKRRETIDEDGLVSEWVAAHTATLCGQYIYIMGGSYTEDGILCATDDAKFDNNAGRWCSLHCSVSLRFHTTNLVDDKLFIIGGMNATTGVHGLQSMGVVIFDIPSATIERQKTYSRVGEAMPMNTRKHIAEYFESKREIVVQGGRPSQIENRYDNQLYALSVDKLVWRKLLSRGKGPQNTQSSHMSCLDAAKDRMFVFAALTRDDTVAKLYDFDYSRAIPYWTLVKTKGNIPDGIYGGSMDLVNGDTLIVFGGVIREIYIRDLYKLDLQSSVWTRILHNPTETTTAKVSVTGTPPLEQARHDSVAFDRKILYFGGDPQPRVSIKTVLELWY